MTESEWAEAKIDFELGKFTASMLADKYKVRRQTISDGMRARGAIYGARSKVVEEASIDAAKSDSRKRADMVSEMKENQRKLIETTQKLATKAMMDAMRDSTPISQKKADVQTLRIIMTIHQAARAELWKIYGLDDDSDIGEEMPEFAISEYTPDELALINRERTGDLNPDDALAELERAAVLDGEGDDPLAGLLDDVET